MRPRVAGWASERAWSRSAEKAKPHRTGNHYTHVRNGARRKLTDISHRSDSDRCENKFIFGFTVWWCWAVVTVVVVVAAAAAAVVVVVVVAAMMMMMLLALMMMLMMPLLLAGRILI